MTRVAVPFRPVAERRPLSDLAAVHRLAALTGRPVPWRP